MWAINSHVWVGSNFGFMCVNIGGLGICLVRWCQLAKTHVEMLTHKIMPTERRAVFFVLCMFVPAIDNFFLHKSSIVKRSHMIFKTLTVFSYPQKGKLIFRWLLTFFSVKKCIIMALRVPRSHNKISTCFYGWNNEKQSFAARLFTTTNMQIVIF